MVEDDGKLVPQDAVALNEASGCGRHWNKSAPINFVSRWRLVSQPREREPESISII